METRQGPPGPRILVVEDDRDMVELLKHMLTPVHSEVLVAYSGDDAIRVLSEQAEQGNPVDLVLLDIMVPGMDGYEVAARMKADPRLRDASIIMTTAIDSVASKTLGLGLGADDYLTKPFDPQELLARIDAVLRVRRSEAALRRRNQELAALVEVNRMVTSSLNMDEILEATMRGIGEIVPAEAGLVVLVGEESGELEVRTTFGPEEAGAGRTAERGEGIIGKVVESGEARLVNDVDRDPQFLPEVDEVGGVTAQSVLCVPLATRNRVIGAMQLLNRSGGGFTEEDQELVQAIAASVAVALENAGLYGELADFAQELERSQAQLVQAEKMAAIGRLAASVAHEINNPLQSIHNTLHLTREKKLDAEKRGRYLQMAQAEVERLIKVVQRMLDFYRPSKGGMARVDVNEIVENVLTLSGKKLQHSGVSVVTDLGELPRVELVQDQVAQVFLNLAINATEAMPSGGELKVKTMLSKDGESVLVRFQDSGEGMSAEQVANLFEPFYTTKQNGTGLGLAISYGIVERHGGDIDVVSQPGAGSTFTVRLPIRGTRGDRSAG
jgi:two-component system NtrC family sensor kinase